MITLLVNEEAKTVAVYEGMRTSVSNLLAEYEDAKIVRNDEKGKIAIVDAIEQYSGYIEVFLNVPTRVINVGQEQPTEKKTFFGYWQNGIKSNALANNEEEARSMFLLSEEIIFISETDMYIWDEETEKWI